jgi:hypothetical protein
MAGPTISTKTSYHPLRLTGAALGILVFLGGIVILVFVFLTAHTLFETPLPPLPTVPPSGSAAAADTSNTASAATVIGQSLLDFAKRLLLLLLMCIAGSVIASRGIELFFKACAAVPPAPGSKPASGSVTSQPAASSAQASSSSASAASPS